MPLPPCRIPAKSRFRILPVTARRCTIPSKWELCCQEVALSRNHLVHLIVRASDAPAHAGGRPGYSIPRAAYRLTGLLAQWRTDRWTSFGNRLRRSAAPHWVRIWRSQDVSRIAESSFVHRVWNLTDLMLADRHLQARTAGRFGGQVPQPYLKMLLDAQQRRHPVILLTAYYGRSISCPCSWDTTGFGPVSCIGPTAIRTSTHIASGSEGAWQLRMIPVDRAASRLSQILDAGGTVAILADHHAERRGVPVTFLGVPTMAMRSVALLAMHIIAAASPSQAFVE